MNYLQYFKISERKDGTKFTHLTEDRPEPLCNLVHSIHGGGFFGVFPNDWIYDKIHSAFVDLDGFSHDDEFECIKNAVQPDIYTVDLLEWAKWGFAQEWIEEAAEVFGRDMSIDRQIANGQYLAIGRIYERVWEWLKPDGDE